MKILFQIVPNQEDQGVYQHNIVCLAEGFKVLGLEFFGNIDYWYEENSDKPLIKRHSSNFDPDIVIYSSHYIRENFKHGVKTLASHISVLIDSEDGYCTVADLYADNFDFVLRSHFNSNRKYGNNVRPWAFGLSYRMINAIENGRSRIVNDQIFINYRVFYNGRRLARQYLDPLLGVKYDLFCEVTDPYSKEFFKKRDIQNLEKSYWWQTGCRHDEEYFNLLNESRFTYAFGGPIVLKSPYFKSSYDLMKVNRKMTQWFLDQRLLSASFVLNYQYDSWRFWEAMFSNAIPIHFDFESWNFVLPVMPVNGTHYIGVEKLDFQGCGTKIMAYSSSDLDKISANGADWAMEHYSPVAVSRRFLNMIDGTK